MATVLGSTTSEAFPSSGAKIEAWPDLPLAKGGASWVRVTLRVARASAG
jgi:hypothetical protein